MYIENNFKQAFYLTESRFADIHNISYQFMQLFTIYENKKK